MVLSLHHSVAADPLKKYAAHTHLSMQYASSVDIHIVVFYNKAKLLETATAKIRIKKFTFKFYYQLAIMLQINVYLLFRDNQIAYGIIV